METAFATAQRRPKSSRISPLAGSLGTFVGCLIAFVGANVVGLIVMFAMMEPSDLSGSPTEMQENLMDVAATLPVVAFSVLTSHGVLTLFPFLVVLIVKADAKEALGLKGAPWQTYVLSVVAALALGPTSDILVRFAEYVLPDFSLGSLEMIEKLVESVSAFALWPFVALLPGIGEEMMFRGLLQRSLGFGWKAITISAISFSFFHLDPHHVAGVLPLGFFIAWVAARTGSTLVPIATHLVNNSTAIFAAQSESLNVGHGTDTPMPVWWIFVGWAIAAPCIYAIWRLTRDRERFIGAASSPASAPAPSDAVAHESTPPPGPAPEE